MNKLRLIMMLPILLVMPAGCVALAGAGAVAGAGAIAYYQGTVSTTEGRDVGQVWLASSAALEKMGYTITYADRKSFGGRIVARALRDERILIELEALSANSTSITIKVGNFGNEKSARIVLQSILTNFPAVPAPSFLPEPMPVQAGSPSREPRAQQVTPAPAGITPDADATKVGGSVPNK